MALDQNRNTAGPAVSVPQASDPVHDETPVTAPAPEFTRNLSVSLVAEFRRLAALNGWTKKSKSYKEEKRKWFKEWAVEDFESEFGRNANALHAWQRLCRMLDVPDTITLGSIQECRGALKEKFVNIVDLVDACKTPGDKPRVFDSDKDLAKYIKRTGKFFPLIKARSSPLLSVFLIDVGIKGGGGRGGRGGGAGRSKRRRMAKAKAAEKALAEANAATTKVRLTH